MDIFFKYKNSKQLRFEGDDIFSATKAFISNDAEPLHGQTRKTKD